MSIVAIVPVAQLLAANAALQTAGYGPRNFSVPAYSAPGATHAAMHTWGDPGFAAAVKALPGVVFDELPGDPVVRTKDLIQAQGAQWGAQAPTLPSTGNVTAGSLWQLDGTLWWVIQTFNRTTFPLPPATYPALIRRVRNPNVAEQWQQPIDQFDSYNLNNPFTGTADQCLNLGKRWRTTINANVFQPGIVGSEALWLEVV